MDKNSQRKITEERVRGLEGNSFQDFCDRLCLNLYPGDYVPVRSGGPQGDTKNDGYCPKARVFFQSHATRGEKLSETQAKIEKDFKGCIAQYKNVKSWIYLTNDTLTGSVHKFVDALRQKYPHVEIELWDHKIITNKISELPKEVVNSILDINLFGDTETLQEIKELLGGVKNQDKNVASSVKTEQVKDMKIGYSGGKVKSLKGKSADYKRVISLYEGKPKEKDIIEIKKIFYSSGDPEATLQAILALASLYEYSPETVEDQNTMLDIGIGVATDMKALDAEAILRAHKGINISTQFILLDLEGWGKVEITNRTGLSVISPQEQARIIDKLKLLGAEFKELFKTSMDKAIESRNYLAVIRVFSMIGSAAGGRAQHFLNLGVKERGEFEKKVCKETFMYAKRMLMKVGDEEELALLMHNFANAIRGFGETSEAMDLVNKAIKIARKNKVYDLLDKGKLLKDRIQNPISLKE